MWIQDELTLGVFLVRQAHLCCEVEMCVLVARKMAMDNFKKGFYNLDLQKSKINSILGIEVGTNYLRVLKFW